MQAAPFIYIRQSVLLQLPLAVLMMVVVVFLIFGVLIQAGIGLITNVMVKVQVHTHTIVAVFLALQVA